MAKKKSEIAEESNSPIEDAGLDDKKREKLLSSIFAKVNKNAVKNGYTTVDKPIVGKASDMAKLVKPRIKTGNVLVDYYTGGGLKRGTSSLWYGPKGVGKSTQALITAGEVGRLGGHTLWVQAEEGDIYDAMKLHGIDPEWIYIVNAKGTAEACFDIVEQFLEANKENPGFVDLIVIDSLAGLAPRSELNKIEKEGGRDEVTGNPGVVAKAYADWYRGLHSTKLLEDAHMMLISQIRDKVGGYGNPEIFVGGHSIEHAPRLLVRVGLGPNGNYVVKKGDLKYNIGHQVKLDLVKDGVSHINQGRQFVYDVYYGHAGRKRGIDNDSALQVLLTGESSAFNQGGAWFTTNPHILDKLPDEKKEQYSRFQGKENIKLALRDSDFLSAAKSFLEEYGSDSSESEEDLEIEDTEEETSE